MNDNEYDALARASKAATLAHDTARAAKGEWLKERRETLQKQADDLFDAEINTLGNAAWETRFKLEAATVVRNMADTGWLPVGTVVVKVMRSGSRFYPHTKQLRGIVEVWSVDSARPATGRTPRNGTVVVRLLKADGKPGLKFDTLYSYAYGKPETGDVRNGWGPVKAKEEVTA